MKKYFLSILMLLAALVQTTHAVRDLEIGTFLTRDPIGYQDGPNVYCYVHCNPITGYDAFGLYTYNAETQELEYDGHYNGYEDGADNSNDPNAGLLFSYTEMESMLDAAQDGYVTLTDGRKVKESSFRAAYEANMETMESTARAVKRGRVAANDAMQDGHMSYTDALRVQGEILKNKSIASKGEHWNARTVLNRNSQLEEMYEKYEKYLDSPWTVKFVFGDEVFKRMYYPGNVYHGPYSGFGNRKWISNKGREFIIDSQGSFEGRYQYIGTYNFGGLRLHKKLDMNPYQKWGNTPHDPPPPRQAPSDFRNSMAP